MSKLTYCTRLIVNSFCLLSASKERTIRWVTTFISVSNTCTLRFDLWETFCLHRSAQSMIYCVPLHTDDATSLPTYSYKRSSGSGPIDPARMPHPYTPWMSPGRVLDWHGTYFTRPPAAGIIRLPYRSGSLLEKVQQFRL